jgi:starvation-inducible outer membrane lipoprotein
MIEAGSLGLQMRRQLLFAFAGLLLAACASAPAAVDQADPHRFGELVPGTSTKEDAVAKLGPATSVSMLPQNQVLVQWIKIDSDGAHEIHVAIRFTPDGRMIRVESVTTI